ncbi:Hypothetical protein, predicted lipoprotein [Mycoplasma yeatsii 13926]|uniref:Lipoprotein n=1 Tax=Mycoplasma yeatsii 13926 TaxID=1188240 RepID=S6G6R1_9MOLU|nr:hypothetical protein [Mycoplasma yeatsii]EOA06963.1 Hypothetical protein, predicted lipoprotein [Mycoplasma yeatsii 13926]
MKKLITLLSTFTFAATGMTGVVSCKKEEQRSNSQFIKGDGEFDIDAKALLSWYKEWNGVNQDEGFINKFYNILAVGLLKGIAEKTDFKLPIGEQAKEVGWDDSLNTELENLLGEKDGSTPNSLYSFAHSALKDKRDNEFKDKHKDYIKFLEDKFKGVKKDQASLENAFLSDYILNDPSNSAFIRLKNTLMFNSTISNSLWRKGIQTNDLDINVIVKKFAGVDVYKNKNTLNDLANAVKEAFSKDSVNWNDSSITSFTDLVNSVGGIDFGKNNNISITYSSPEQIKDKIKKDDKADWIKTILKRFSNKDDNSNKGIIEFSNFVQTDNYDGPSNFVNFEGLSPRSWSKIVKQIPVLNGKDLKRDDIKGSFGSITDSQKFSIDNYFHSEKPVMVSDLIFNFANSKKKEDVEKQLSIEALVPISSTGNDLTKELVNRFQGIAATLKAYVKDDEKEGNNNVPDTAGMGRFDTIFRGASRVLKADVAGNAKSFKDWIQWDKENTYHKINKTGDLLTISDTSFSNVAKYSVYDFLTNQNDDSNNFSWSDDQELKKEDLTKYGLSESRATSVIDALEKHKETKTAIANVIKLFEKINQKAPNGKEAEETDNNGKNMNKNMFTVLNKENGIIAYIDGDGLHITKIDGYKLMKTQPSDKKEIDINKQTAVLKKIDSLYGSEFGKDLVPYLVNSMLKDTKAKMVLRAESEPSESTSVKSEEKIWDWSANDLKNSTSVANMGVEIEHLNNNIRNNYERFLVNTSLIDNTKTKTFYNTNILNEASKATDSSDKNLGSQASWLLGLFSKVFEKNDLINELVKLPTEESIDKKAEANIKSEFDNLVKKVILDRQKMERTAAIGKFLSDNQKWLESIQENWKTQSKDITNDINFIPDQGINLDSDEGKRFKALLNSEIFNPNQEMKNEREEM